MPQRMAVDIVAAVLGALVYVTAPAKADQLGGWLFLAGSLAALMAQR